MQKEVHKYLKFYDNKRLITFKVHSKEDAYKTLERLKLASGWYVERSKASNAVLVNDRIYRK